MSDPRHWKEHEVRIIRANYAKYGYKRVQEKLPHRSRAAINKKARMLGLTYGDIKGMVPAVSVHPRPQDSGDSAHSRVIRAAREDGVLQKLKAGEQRVYLVPEEWADEYVKRLAVELDERRRTKTWLTSVQAAEVMGVTFSTICKVGNGNTDPRHVREAMKGVRRAKFDYNQGVEFRWHPGDVEEAALRYRAIKRGLL